MKLETFIANSIALGMGVRCVCVALGKGRDALCYCSSSSVVSKLVSLDFTVQLITLTTDTFSAYWVHDL